MRRAFIFRSLPTRSFLARVTGALAITALVATSAACDDAGPTTPTTTTTTAPTFTETFSGVLPKNGAVTFPFVASAAGTATATLADVTPVSSLRLGMAMGTWNGSSCQSIISNDNAFEFSTIVGTIGSAGDLCLRVYDIGAITTTSGFTITVVHP